MNKKPISRNHILFPILFIFSMLLFPVSSMAQDYEEEEDELEIVDENVHMKMMKRITDKYADWETVELNGKLKMDLLPLSPSVKIFMKRGEEILVSVRAPLMGEVARLELTPQGALAVNKMKKKYTLLDLSRIAADAPVTISDLQDLLLGRIFVMDAGTLSMDAAALVEIFGSDKEGYAIVPVKQPEEYDVVYGYEADKSGDTTFFIVGKGDDSTYLMADYTPKKKGEDILFTIGHGDKEYEALLQLEAPKWGASPLERIALDKKYQEVGLRNLLR